MYVPGPSSKIKEEDASYAFRCQGIKREDLMSSGHITLDSILGGGIPFGSIFLLEKDETTCRYVDVILKHAISEGILSRQTLIMAGLECDVKKLVSNLPSPAGLLGDDDFEAYKKLKIAWRYGYGSSDLKKSHRSVGLNNIYDMTKPLLRSDIDATNINYWDPGIEVKNYNEFLGYLCKTLSTDERKNKWDREICRVFISDLGTAGWTGDMISFLLYLRCLISSLRVVVFITISNNLIEDECTKERCKHMCDTILSFTRKDKQSYPLRDGFQGFLNLIQLPSIHRLMPHVPDTSDWVFKLGRKHFVIEKLHLTPEEEENVKELTKGLNSCNVASTKGELF